MFTITHCHFPRMNIHAIKTVADIDDETSAWLEGATREEIGMALNLGCALVSKLGKMQARPRTSERAQSHIPVARGQIGEDHVQRILEEKFGRVENTTKMAKKGDMSLFMHHRKITVEVKNYTGVVPASQVEKFQRDLCTTNASGGIFISLNTPISCIPDSFVIRYEHVETRSVPCAYLVSSDDNAIVLAVNMIHQLLTASEFAAAEMYARDNVIGDVYRIADSLDDISKVRNELQLEIGNITGKLIKTSMGLVSAESCIRDSISGIKTELFHAQEIGPAAALAAIEVIPYYTKQRESVKKCIQTVLSRVQELLHQRDQIGAWRVSAKKCTSVHTGASITFGASAVKFSIPRTRVSPEMVLASLDSLDKKVSVDEHMHIDIDESTIDWICKLLS